MQLTRRLPSTTLIYEEPPEEELSDALNNLID